MTIPERFHLTYKRYIQKGFVNPSFDYESIFYHILFFNRKLPEFVIDVTYDTMLYKYEFKLYSSSSSSHVATAYMYEIDLEEFMEHRYEILSSKPTGTFTKPQTIMEFISTYTKPTNITNTTNTTTKKDNTMNADYDATTIDTMIEELLQKKAALIDIESRWKKDEDFNDGDVIVVEYSYSNDEGAKVYTGALLKTKVGWFTTLTHNLLGANKYSYIVKFFEKIYVKRVVYLAVSEGVEMFSNVAESDADADA